jgi:ABC transporter substrate binding protein
MWEKRGKLSSAVTALEDLERLGPTLAPAIPGLLSRDRLNKTSANIITLLGGAAAEWRLAAPAQQGMRRIGVLMAYEQSDREGQAFVAAFREGLEKLGWMESRRLQPDLILSNNTPTTLALLEHTQTIPIIFAIVADPLGSRFVTSFARPGGQAAAASLGLEPIAAPVRDMAELDILFGAQTREPNGGVIAMPDGFLSAHRSEITSMAVRHRLPAVYPYRFFADLGGLLSYGTDQSDNFRRAATYVDRILKGANPSDLPAQAPIKLELVINLKTAKILGIEVPLFLQQRADEIIE